MMFGYRTFNMENDKMRISGLQKLTLLDFPEHTACTVFLGGCDLRCPFCHNFELVDGTAKPMMEEEAFFSFLDKRHGLLDGVAITGGEPCLRKELKEFIKRIRAMGFAVKLDTNGLHPDVLGELLGENLLDYIAMDIKNSPEKYALTAGLEKLELAPVYESIRLLMEGEAAYEFRTTVVKEFHEESDFYDIAKMIEGAKQYYLQSFTDRDSVPFEGLHAHDADELRRFAKIMEGHVGAVHLRGVE